MSILVGRLLSVAGQSQFAKDAQNFYSGWVLMVVFTFISPLKVPAHRIDKRFFIGEYFGKGTFECCGAMPSGQRCSKLLLWLGFNDGFHFDFSIESNGS